MESKAKVRILNKEYIIKGDVDFSYIENLAKKVDKRILEIKDSSSKDTDEMQLLILLALNLMDEVEMYQEKNRELPAEEITQRTNRLISMLEKGIIGDES
ncbi:MAG: cell division protein ZapA [Spirochaetia bacterium]|nr:cell division protein ZapA [Spirochaetia bacterium]